jgi:hypothetical protein
MRMPPRTHLATLLLCFMKLSIKNSLKKTPYTKACKTFYFKLYKTLYNLFLKLYLAARRRTKTSFVRQRCGAEERADDDAEGTRKRTFEVDGEVQNRIRSSKQVKHFCSLWSNRKQDQTSQTG